ncbi:MAG: hypothetical protein JSS11_14640 [Verrucomicrobia bacterium]|nr:hypothetical protein [Verrucomicrobiota bacterium]
MLALLAVAGTAVLHGQTAGAAAPDLPPDIVAMLTNPAAWSGSVTLHGGAGYKDNLLLSRYAPEGSAFARAGVEAFLWRLPEGRTEAYAFLNAEDTRYRGGLEVDHETEAVAQAEWRYRIGEKLRFSLMGQGYWLDEVFDVSDTDILRTVALLQVTGVAAGPALRWDFAPQGWLETKGTAKRETFRDGSNNNHLYEGEVRLGWRPADRLEASLGEIWRERSFDHRQQYSAGGRPRPGTRLHIGEEETELSLTAKPGRAKHWKLVTRAGRLTYADNGSGYFNYREHKLAETAEWTAGDWLVRLEASARRLVYEVQTVGLGAAPPARLKESYATELRVERKLSARWTAYAEYTWERSRSNYTLAAYLMNEGLLGVQWSWEK